MTSDSENLCFINGIGYKCRTCFNPGQKLYSLTEEANNTETQCEQVRKTWRDLLMNIAPSEIKNEDDSLPNTLCCKCLEKLKSSHEFIQQIHDVNKKYSQLLANSNDPLHEGLLVNAIGTFSEYMSIDLPAEQDVPEIKMVEQQMIVGDIILNNQLQENIEETLKEEIKDAIDTLMETYNDIKPLEELSDEENESAEEKSAKKTKLLVERAKIREKRSRKFKKAKENKKSATDKLEDSVENIEIKDDHDSLSESDNDDFKQSEDEWAKEPEEEELSIVTRSTRKQKHSKSKNTEDSDTDDEKIKAIWEKFVKNHPGFDDLDWDDNTDKCPICPKVSGSKYKIMKHITTAHEKVRLFKCSHCPKTFGSKTTKQNHEVTHTDEYPFECKWCDRRFRQNSKLTIHMEIHTTKPELLCSVCHRAQKTTEDLEEHMKTHHDKRLECPDCGNIFRRQANLTVHYKKAHFKLLPFKCQYCEVEFGTQKALRRHESKHHIEDSGTESENDDFKSSGDEWSNQGDESSEAKRIKKPKIKKRKRALPNGKKTTIWEDFIKSQPGFDTLDWDNNNMCPICSKVFAHQYSIVEHIRTVHEKVKPFQCSHCPKTFSTIHSKRGHELSHTDIFPFECKYCNRRFRLSSKLKIHTEIHTTKPELLCPICHRAQKSTKDLEEHVKDHDDKRLQCPSCGHFFRRQSALTDHYNAVHLKLRPYKCQFCESDFGDRKSRRMHERKYHKDLIPPPPTKISVATTI